MVKDKIRNIFSNIKRVKDDAVDKNRDALDKAYEARKPAAVAKVEELRLAKPTATPKEILSSLEKDLAEAEKQFGLTSEQFSAEAMSFVISSFEVHRQASGKTISRSRTLDILMVVDSKAVKIARKIVGGAFIVASIFPVAKAAKGAKGTKAALKVGVALVTAKSVLDKTSDSGKVSQFLISSVKKHLGPTPSTWANETNFREKSTKSGKSSKK